GEPGAEEVARRRLGVGPAPPGPGPRPPAAGAGTGRPGRVLGPRQVLRAVVAVGDGEELTDPMQSAANVVWARARLQQGGRVAGNVGGAMLGLELGLQPQPGPGGAKEMGSPRLADQLRRVGALAGGLVAGRGDQPQ